MKYKTRTVSLQKLILARKGPLNPLCNDCVNQDCSHPIERKSVSVIGVNKDWWLLAKGYEQHLVIECDGYSKAKRNSDENDISIYKVQSRKMQQEVPRPSQPDNQSPMPPLQEEADSGSDDE